MKPDILVAPHLYEPVMKSLEEAFTVHGIWQAKDQADFLAQVGDKIRAIANFSTFPLKRDLIDALPRLEVIGCMSVGVDHIDLAAAKARGIPVTNAPDVLTDCVADIGMSLVLAVARRLVSADRFVRSGQWLKGSFPFGNKLGGATLGIVGLGRIGKAVAKRAEAFGIGIVYFGRHRQEGIAYPFYGDLKTMAAESDYLMLTCPGGPATRNLIDAEVLGALGREGVLINIARGSVVDEAAMVAALKEGRLGGAGLDVYAAEPQVPEALFALDNVVLLPHIASATHGTRAAMGHLMVDNLKAHFAGKPLLTPVT